MNSKTSKPSPQFPKSLPPSHTKEKIVISKEVPKKRKKTQKEEKLSALKVTFYLIFNSVDLITDILFILKISRDHISSDNPQNLQIFIILILGMLIERYQLFQISLQMTQTLKNNPINQQTSLNLREKLCVFFYIITFSEYLILLKFKENPPKMLSFRKKIQIIDLCCEKILFFFMGSLFTFQELILDQEEFSILVIGSTLMSFTSCVQILFQFQLLKIQSSNKYKSTNFKELSTFTSELQEIITYPLTFPFLKFNKIQNKPFLKQIKKITFNLNNNNKNNNNNSVIVKGKVSFLKKIYILIFIFITLCESTLLYVLPSICVDQISMDHYLILAFVLGLPMLIKHTKILYKFRKTNQYFLKKLILLILNIPTFIFIQAQIFFLPHVTYEIPFIKGTKDTWRHNYYSTSYKLLVSVLCQSFTISIVRKAIQNQENIAQELTENGKGIVFIVNPNGYYRILYNIAIILFIIQFVFRMMYAIDKMATFYLQRQENKEKEKQKQKYSIQDSEINSPTQIALNTKTRVRQITEITSEYGEEINQNRTQNNTEMQTNCDEFQQIDNIELKMSNFQNKSTKGLQSIEKSQNLNINININVHDNINLNPIEINDK